MKSFYIEIGAAYFMAGNVTKKFWVEARDRAHLRSMYPSAKTLIEE